MENKHVKSSELRIGNKVLFIDLECTVIECRKHPTEDMARVEYFREDTQALHRPLIEESRLFSIPLSIDRILSFGFELSSDEGDCKFYEKGKYGIRWVDGDEFYFYLIMSVHRDEYWILKEIYDVHQLQNIWLDLTDEELTIKSEKN